MVTDHAFCNCDEKYSHTALIKVYANLSTF